MPDIGQPAQMLDLAALIDRVVARVDEFAALAGVALEARLAIESGAAARAMGRLEPALLMLLGGMLMGTPRGGRITLDARIETSGVICLDLRGTATAANLARSQIELRSGASIADCVQRAQRLVALDGGTVRLANGPGKSETVSLRLPPAVVASSAA